jgi:hypothetical protein
MTALGKFIFAFAMMCALPRGTQAQATARNSEMIEAIRVAQAVRVDGSPKMHGTLDDPLWQQAVPVKDFRQKEPYEGQSATETRHAWLAA